MRNNASLSDFGLTSLFTLFFYNQIINTIFIKTFLIFYLIIYVYYSTRIENLYKDKAYYCS